MAPLDPFTPPFQTSQPSEAAQREVAALRAMLGLPLDEPESDERAPPETTQPDEQIPPITPSPTKLEGEQP